MSRTRHVPHWNKTNGHGFLKKLNNKRLRRTVIKKTGPG